MFRYRLHDTEGNDLGELQHPAPNLEPGDTVMTEDGIVWFRDSANGRIVALDARNGRRLWTSKPLLARYEGQGSPVLAGGTLLLAAEQGLVAYRVGR